ncbi:MAG: protein kinase [Polyangia bacterium]|jgi:serine/threonine protein kinase/uncharacterized RDD family membrane protein YckC|nr:protein kinase [Polyangia bacterium]
MKGLPSSDPLVGRTLHHFRVICPIGAGGMGRVYRAHDLSLDRPVALKIIAEEVSLDPAKRDRFVREARAQAKLTHPNVVSIFYVGEQEGLLFFAMELVEGEALDVPLRQGGRLPWPEALAAVISAGEALHAAHHRGVVHRDVKPSNLLRDADGTVKIADFGLAKIWAPGQVAGAGPDPGDALGDTAMDLSPLVPGTPQPGASKALPAVTRPDSPSQTGPNQGSVGSRPFGSRTPGSGDEQLTQAGAVLGSPLYLSPEQADGQAADHRSDMYSLGATLFHLVAGRPVFEAKSATGVLGMHLSAPVPSLRKVAPEAGVPKRLEKVVRRLLAKRPEDRYSTWEEALAALREAQPQNVARAGFWVRGFAFWVDFGLMSIPVVFLRWVGVVMAAAYLVLSLWLFGCTFGKWLFRLRVRTDEGERLGLGRALLRLVCQCWVAGVLIPLRFVSTSVFGTSHLDFDDPVVAGNQAMAVIVVVCASVAFAFYIFGYLWAGIRRHKAAWHDLWSRTRVVYDLPEAGAAPRSQRRGGTHGRPGRRG